MSGRPKLDRQSICKGCGSMFPHKNKKVFCSNDCKVSWNQKNKWKTVVFLCFACKKTFTKVVQISRPDPVCCSDRCQKKLAAKRLRQRDVEWWTQKSQEAKAQWEIRLRRHRYAQNAWMQCCSSHLSTIKAKRRSFLVAKKNPWVKRCRSALSLLGRRLEPVAGEVKLEAKRSWLECLENQQTCVLRKAKTKRKATWELKCTIVSGTMKRRRSLLKKR